MPEGAPLNPVKSPIGDDGAGVLKPRATEKTTVCPRGSRAQWIDTVNARRFAVWEKLFQLGRSSFARMIKGAYAGTRVVVNTWGS